MCRKTALKKLQSETGATLMLALLFFIMCAVAGSIILASATGAAGRAAGTSSDSTQSITQRKENIQDYYTLTSAAGFLVSQIKGKSVIIRIDRTVSGTDGATSTLTKVHLMPAEDADPTEADWPGYEEWETAKTRNPSVLESIAYTYSSSENAAGTQMLRISLPSDDTFKDAVCELQYDKTCNITAKLYTNDNSAQYVTVEIPAQISNYTTQTSVVRNKSGTIVSKETIDMTRISWTSATVSASAVSIPSS